MSPALSSAGYFKSQCCKQYGQRSDCFSRNSLTWVHTVYLYAKSMFEKFARRCSSRHKQMIFSDVVFLGILRVDIEYKIQCSKISNTLFHLSGQTFACMQLLLKTLSGMANSVDPD